MPTLASGSYLLDMAQNELRIPVTNTVERSKIASVMALVYNDICAKQDWWWLATRYDTQTVPQLTGTASLVQNSSNVTLSTIPTRYGAQVSLTGYRFFVDGQVNDALAVYQLAAHTAGTLTADFFSGSTNVAFPVTDPMAVYTGETNTAASYRATQDLLPLPSDVAKLYFVRRYGMTENMRRVGWEELSRLQSFDRSVGRPQVYTIWDYDPSPVFQRYIRYHPISDVAYRLEVHYKKAHDILSGGTFGNPMCPPEFAQVILYGALARCYPIFLNDLERGAYYQSLFNDVMALMAAQQREYASDHPGIDPDMSMYRSWRGDRRRRAGLSLGEWFDRLPYSP